MTGIWRMLAGAPCWTAGAKCALALVCATLAASTAAGAADPAAAWADYLEGDYQDAIKVARAELKEAPGNTDWAYLLVHALLAVGRNAEADAAMRDALERDEQNIRLRWLARDVAFANGRPDEAKARVEEIRRLVSTRPWMYRTAADMVVFGRAVLELGADAKDVLDKVYAVAQRGEPKLRDVYLARGELALAKHDFALAAKAFEEGLKELPDDPDLLAGRAQAYANGEREIAIQSLQKALDKNPRHVPSLLLLADHHIDSETYDEARKTLDEAITVNPTHPEAWAYRAVLAHLRNDPRAENHARTNGLSTWNENPRVDYLIGKKLAQKYRFAEAAAYQRRARAFDPTFLPASAELAQNLLRLGEEAEGWALAQAVHDRDEYDVEAFNLVTLRETMEKYAALTNNDFVIRMAAPEVAVYGPRVLALLRRAQQVLETKYGAQLARPTYIEIFADQRDFAVRTFGLPDVAGFLGVCFGRVVTANSPATSTSPTNWEAVLWHEFCHVVTLQLTKNKMPRWLSEGISVYEERQANRAWGTRLNPRYREMILDGELAPVGKMSAAFLAPKTPEHLQFAYLQSSLVVEFIIERFGISSLRQILMDLRDGIEINAALAKRTLPLAQLEKDFEIYARAQAEALAPGLDWEKPDSGLFMAAATEKRRAWAEKRPNNYWMLRHQIAEGADEENWTAVRAAAEKLVQLYPQQKGADSAYRSLVAALRAIGDATAEEAVLRRWVEVDDEAPDAYLRLMELAAAAGDWASVTRNVDRYLAVNPLVAPPYRYLAQASSATNDDASAVIAWRTLLQLDASDPAGAHFNLAQALQRRGELDEARRHVLLALEETPRYREALRLLVELQRPPPPPLAVPTAEKAPAPPGNG